MSYSGFLLLGVQHVHDIGGYRFKVAYKARSGRTRIKVEDGNGGRRGGRKKEQRKQMYCSRYQCLIHMRTVWIWHGNGQSNAQEVRGARLYRLARKPSRHSSNEKRKLNTSRDD